MYNTMSKEESYADRRQLFKNIWETAMNIDEKDPDIMLKPKVIKTLRLDEVDRCVVAKRKKERIKNLRHVCNKILDFCDRQDADDIYYGQMTTEGYLMSKQHDNRVETKIKKSKKYKHRKIKKAKSLTATAETTQAKITTSETNEEIRRDFGTKISRDTSPIKIKRTTVVKKSTASTKFAKAKSSKNVKSPKINHNSLGDATTTAPHRKTVKEKIVKERNKM